MRIVIDTNVIVSGALRDRDPEAMVLRAVGDAGLEWVASDAIVDEYLRVFARPKLRLTPEVHRRWRDLILGSVTIVPVTVAVDWPPDQKDAMFAACALAARADVLVSGDRGFTPGHRIGSTIVATARQMLTILESEAGGDIRPEVS